MRKSRKSDAELWRVPVRVEHIPDTGAHFALVAAAEMRHAIAAAADLVALPRFEAAFEVKRHGRGGARVVGRVSADIRQTCVVTLEPLESTVDEPVDVTFVPPSATSAPAEEVVPHDGDDPPDPLVDGILDLGAVAMEFLLLGIDPYPRKPDADFVPPPVDDTPTQEAHPFAALAALKKSEPEGH